MRKILLRFIKAPIRFYRAFLSPGMVPACRFHPTCSAYALEALETHGAIKGLMLAIWRILRCHPWSRSGADPVPTRLNWAFDWRGFFGYKRP
jgi:uncharacterized protein